jgi:hypothetical protein
MDSDYHSSLNSLRSFGVKEFFIPHSSLKSLLTSHYSLLIILLFNKNQRTMKNYIQPEIEVKVSNLEMFMQVPSKTLPVSDDETINDGKDILTKEREGFEYEW